MHRLSRIPLGESEALPDELTHIITVRGGQFKQAFLQKSGLRKGVVVLGFAPSAEPCRSEISRKILAGTRLLGKVLR